MKYSLFVLAIFFGLGFDLSLWAQTRTWSDLSKRHSVEASFVSLSDDMSVTLKKNDGATLRVPFDKLSLDDQQFIRDKVPSRFSLANTQGQSNLPVTNRDATKRVPVSKPEPSDSLPIVVVRFPVQNESVSLQTKPFILHCFFELNPKPEDVKQILAWQARFDIRGISLFFGHGVNQESLDSVKSIPSVREIHAKGSVSLLTFKTGLLNDFKELETLELDSCIVSVDLFEDLGQLPELRTLILKRMSITNGGLDLLRHSKSLKDLSILSCNKVSEHTMESLGTLSGLEKLSLQLPDLPSGGFLHVPDLTTLKHLELVQTPVPAQYITHFKRFQQLKTLVLEDCPGLDSGSIDLIRALLPQCQIQLQRSGNKKSGDDQADGKQSKTNKAGNIPQKTGVPADTDEEWPDLDEPKPSSQSSSPPKVPGKSPSDPNQKHNKISTSAWAGIHIGDSIEQIKAHYEVLDSRKSSNSDRVIYRVKPKQQKYSEIIVACREKRCVSILIHFAANTPRTYELLHRIHSRRFRKIGYKPDSTVQNDKAQASFEATENGLQLAIYIKYEKTAFTAAQVSVFCIDEDELNKEEF